MPKPIPIIGPINGDINMAPMITAVEFTFKPSDATKMAKIKIHKLVPRKTTPLSIFVITVCRSSFSRLILNLSKNFVNEIKFVSEKSQVVKIGFCFLDGYNRRFEAGVSIADP